MRSTITTIVAMIFLAIFVIFFGSFTTAQAGDYFGTEFLTVVELEDTLTGGPTSVSIVASRFFVPQSGADMYFIKGELDYEPSSHFKVGGGFGGTFGFFENDAMLLNLHTKITVFPHYVYGFAEHYDSWKFQSAVFWGFGYNFMTTFRGRDVDLGFAVEGISNYADHSYVESNAWVGPQVWHDLGNGWKGLVYFARYMDPLFSNGQGWGGRLMLEKDLDVNLF